MRLLICAGGTGGGVYPALAVLQALRKRFDDTAQGKGLSGESRMQPAVDLSVEWVGAQSGMEAELVRREGLTFRAIPAAGVHGVSRRRLPANLWKLAGGLLHSRRLLRRFQPDVVLFTGGYLAVPVALAARFPFRSYPRPRSLLYVPDIQPGLALRAVARFADQIALTTEDTRQYLPPGSRTVVTGYPVRPELHAWAPYEARQALGLSADLPTLLVLGGSRGARSINRALLSILPTLLAEMQVVHISGHLDWPEIEQAHARLSASLPAEQARRYRPFAYLHREMGAALSVANLVVSRAGASTLGEYPLFGLPAILVPYPHAWRYQQVNAQYLVDRGAARLIQDADLPSQLLPAVRSLIHDPQSLSKMSAAMRSLALPDAADRLADQLIRLAQMPKGRQA